MSNRRNRKLARKKAHRETRKAMLAQVSLSSECSTDDLNVAQGLTIHQMVNEWDDQDPEDYERIRIDRARKDRRFKKQAEQYENLQVT